MRLFKLIPAIIFLVYSSNCFAQPDKEIFAERRTKLMEQISDGIAVMVSPDAANRNGDVDYEYRQESNFYYLSGFEEQSSCLIIDPNATDKYILFVKPKNPAREVWTGILTGLDKAVTEYGADKSYEIKQFDSVLALYSSKKIYILSSDKNLAAKIKGINPQADTGNLSEIIGEMRLIKSAYEIGQMKKAIDITCNALIESMKSAKPGMYEYELQAILEYNFKKEGCTRNGFPSIVGSGPNSCILHYETNQRKTQNGDIVVMDVGAEYGYYSADVTRTFPLNGKYSEAQKTIYNIVLKAQSETIDALKPGMRFYQVDSIARAVVTSELRKIGLLDDTTNSRKFFMHGTSHWVGLDVHDAGKYSENGVRGRRVLEPGMVLTVEPGVYIAAGIEGVDPKYYNIGVRIEDDLLITETGHELMSKLAPRQISDIEKVMSKK